VLEFFSPRVRRLKRRRDVAELIALLQHRSRRVRRTAANALVSIPDRRSLEPLVAALGDEDPAVRANAALALGEFEDVRAETPLAAIVDPLATALRDRDPSVRVMAASALGRRKDSRAIGHLERALQDENELVRKAAAAVLAGFRNEEPGEAHRGVDHTPSAS
jgi:vesicle coat complex subunit